MTFYMVFYFTFCTSRSNFFAISTVICHTMSSSIQHIDTDIFLVVNQKICYLKESHFYFNTSAPFSQILYFRGGGSALNQGGHFVFIIYYLFLLFITCYLLFISYYLSHLEIIHHIRDMLWYNSIFHQQLEPSSLQHFHILQTNCQHLQGS